MTAIGDARQAYTGYNGTMTEILRLRDTDPLLGAERCKEVLDAGGLVILPTDTVYGLAARADLSGAVRAVFEAKGREEGKALVIMVSEIGEAAALAAPELSENVWRMGEFWPGPLTLVVRVGDVPWKDNVARGSKTLGIRIPNSPFLLHLLGISGPLAVTSANPSGGEAPSSFGDIDAGLLRKVGIAVDGGDAGSGQPSTVAEVGEDGIKVLRRGEITEADLRRVLKRGTFSEK